MKIVDRNTVLQNNNGTLTVGNIGTYLGENTKRLGVMATMYPENTLTALTDTLFNVYYGKTKKKESFTPINAMAIEWEIDVNFIKKVYLDGYTNATELGANQEVFIVYTKEKYYDPGDTFSLENKQSLFVTKPPKRMSQNKWAYSVRLVASSLSTIVDVAYLAAGKYSMYVSNYQPELSSTGYTKFVSNTELHRNYMSRHRHGIQWSQYYAATENTYMETTIQNKRTYLKGRKKEVEVLDIFMYSRENNMLFGESNFDIHGKCLLQDNKGQDIPMGDGVIKQAERYAGRYFYSTFTSNVVDTIIEALTTKANSLTGNTFVFVTNVKLYNDFGRGMKNDDRLKSTDGTFLYSIKSGKEIEIGGNFKSYTFQGNTIVFTPNKALTDRYPSEGYGVLLDLTPDAKSGKPGLASYTLDGSEMISGSLEGLGGKDGKSSGVISTPVTGSEFHVVGYSGIILFNPYKSHIVREQ